MNNKEVHHKLAILYDGLAVNGGAEALALTLAALTRESLLCVDYIGPAFSRNGESQALKKLGRYSPNVFLRHWLGVRHFRHRTGFLSGYDVVVYSGSLAPCAVHQHDRGQNVLYCHTPPRFVYDLRDYWVQRARWWELPFLRFLIWYVRRHYEAAFGKMDLIIANSENVRRRIAQFLGRDSVVIHPPCDTGKFLWHSQGDYFLSTSRLEPYKRVRELVLAFLEMPDKKLVVTSGGSELSALQELAAGAPNISFTGWVSNEQLQILTGQALATLYIPIDEDFGISPVESMAAGKPVIGVAQGGLLETVVPDQTGILIPPEIRREDIKRAVCMMTPELALGMRRACERRAQLFSTEVFAGKMRQVLEMG